MSSVDDMLRWVELNHGFQEVGTAIKEPALQFSGPAIGGRSVQNQPGIFLQRPGVFIVEGSSKTFSEFSSSSSAAYRAVKPRIWDTTHTVLEGGK